MTNLAKHLEKINSELDECVETSKNIIKELENQDEHIEQITKITNSIEEKVTWSEYLLNIINSYFNFLWVRPPKFLYKNTVNDDMEDLTQWL
jgi:peptidoglycan hydrolase CwlO-like protein